jgi:hypothetical protein
MGPRATHDCIVPVIRKSIRFGAVSLAALLLCWAIGPFLGPKALVPARPGARMLRAGRNRATPVTATIALLDPRGASHDPKGDVATTRRAELRAAGQGPGAG